MNFTYFRKSQINYDEVLKNIENIFSKYSIKIQGITNLYNDQGKIYHFCNSQWLEKIINIDKNLMTFLPCGLVVLKDGNQAKVGLVDPKIISKLTHNASSLNFVNDISDNLKKLVDEVTQVGPLKIEKIKLYATMTCPYCKMEEAWLKENKINFDHVLVDLNQKAAEEMVAKSGQMGVPVTEIIFDNGESEIILGFDKERLKDILKID